MQNDMSDANHAKYLLQISNARKEKKIDQSFSKADSQSYDSKVSVGEKLRKNIQN